jgi:hypothetical protein
MKHDPSKRITVGDLREHLELLPDDFELIFGDEDLSFYRTKRRGPKLVQIEFNEIYTVKEPS